MTLCKHSSTRNLILPFYFEKIKNLILPFYLEKKKVIFPLLADFLHRALEQRV